MTQASDVDYLFLIPLGLSITFMVWVLWNLTRQLKRKTPSCPTALSRPEPNSVARGGRNSGTAALRPLQ